MDNIISIEEISIFSFFQKDAIEELSKLFKVVELAKGDIVARYNEEMTGLYVLLDGTVEVFTEGMTSLLAVLERGSSIGEMSLVESGQKSSANLQVSSPAAHLMGWDKKVFQDFLASDPLYEKDFYKGAALTICRRLRSTNSKISTNLKKASELMSSIIEDSKVLKYLGHTKEGINETGSKIVGEIFEVLPVIEKLCHGENEELEKLQRAKEKIEEIALIESQNFDKISQQMDMIAQYFSNINRVLTGQTVIDIKGDKNLFDK